MPRGRQRPTVDFTNNSRGATVNFTNMNEPGGHDDAYLITVGDSWFHQQMPGGQQRPTVDFTDYAQGATVNFTNMSLTGGGDSS
jgi:hypothetical protein